VCAAQFALTCLHLVCTSYYITCRRYKDFYGESMGRCGQFYGQLFDYNQLHFLNPRICKHSDCLLLELGVGNDWTCSLLFIGLKCLEFFAQVPMTDVTLVQDNRKTIQFPTKDFSSSLFICSSQISLRLANGDITAPQSSTLAWNYYLDGSQIKNTLSFTLKSN